MDKEWKKECKKHKNLACGLCWADRQPKCNHGNHGACGFCGKKSWS